MMNHPEKKEKTTPPVVAVATAVEKEAAAAANANANANTNKRPVSPFLGLGLDEVIQAASSTLSGDGGDGVARAADPIFVEDAKAKAKNNKNNNNNEGEENPQSSVVVTDVVTSMLTTVGSQLEKAMSEGIQAASSLTGAAGEDQDDGVARAADPVFVEKTKTNYTRAATATATATATAVDQQQQQQQQQQQESVVTAAAVMDAVSEVGSWLMGTPPPIHQNASKHKKDVSNKEKNTISNNNNNNVMTNLVVSSTGSGAAEIELLQADSTPPTLISGLGLKHTVAATAVNANANTNVHANESSKPYTGDDDDEEEDESIQSKISSSSRVAEAARAELEQDPFTAVNDAVSSVSSWITGDGGSSGNKKKRGGTTTGDVSVSSSTKSRGSKKSAAAGSSSSSVASKHSRSHEKERGDIPVVAHHQHQHQHQQPLVEDIVNSNENNGMMMMVTPYQPLEEQNNRASITTTTTTTTSSGLMQRRQSSMTNTSEHKLHLQQQPPKYKGFSTSISHAFAKPSTAKVDCCSIAFCGFLQSDMNNFVVSGNLPPPFYQRVLLNVVLPVSLFLIVTVGYVKIPDPVAAKFLAPVCAVLLCLVAVVLCVRARRKRVNIRRQLLWRRGMASRGTVYMLADDGANDLEHLGQSQNDQHCAHRFVGCYPVDDDFDDCNNNDDCNNCNNNDDLEAGGGQGQQQRDFCGCLSKTLTSACCGKSRCSCCKCYLVGCGMCATAQEAREAEMLIPLRHRMIDYITFQPYVEYYGEIMRLRVEKLGSLKDHYMTLSKLSLVMLKAMGFLIAVLVVCAFVPWKWLAGIRWPHLIVVLATFAQAFLMLFLVHWQWNRFDVSLDAVIKYFSCGFFLATFLAISFEFIVGFIIEVGLLLTLTCYNLVTGNIANIEIPSSYGAPGFGQMRILKDAYYVDDYYNDNVDDDAAAAAAASEGYEQFGFKDHPVISVVFLLLKAFVMAALVEEMCKYYGFQMVEHPDFMPKDELEEAATIVYTKVKLDRGDRGGVDDDGTSSLPGKDASTVDTMESSKEEGAAANAAATRSSSSQKESGTPSSSWWAFWSKSSVVGGGGSDGGQAVADFSEQNKRTRQSVAAGVTVAMVSVAIGFATLENFIYEFVYSEQGIKEGLYILAMRSLFPVHPLCAAIQSIGMCKRLVEQDKSYSMGWVIMPAMLLHGTYDAALMLLNYYEDYIGKSSSSGEEDEFQQDLEADSMFVDMISLWVPILSWVVPFMIVLFGFLFYFIGATNQRTRLMKLDQASSGDRLIQ